MAMNLGGLGPRVAKPGDMVTYIENADPMESVTWPAVVTLVDPQNTNRVCLMVIMSEGFLFPPDVEFGTGDHNWTWRS